VIGGTATGVDAAIAALAQRGVRKAVKLAVSVPSHTPLMHGAADQLAQVMESLVWSAPNIPVVQNVDAAIHTDVASIRAALARQLYLPVRWTECVQALRSRGVTRIGECGPGKVLAGLIRRIDKSIETRGLGTSTDFDATLRAWRGS
jgi:[acyl-carrier-protein] S-malonyltransferase